MIDRAGFERLIGWVLRFGVILAATVVLTGGILYLARHGGESPRYETFRGEPVELRSIAGVAAGARAGDARSIIQLGLLILIATPIARVFFSAVAFAIQKDGTYVAINLLVLGVLLWSLTGT